MGGIYKHLLRPVLFRGDAESVHELGIRALRLGLATGVSQSIAEKRFRAPAGLGVECFGLQFENPVGIAAGFDKNGVVVDQLASLGFGFVEVGTVTRVGQPGNSKPRMFRLPGDNALINRLGFNNRGAKALVASLEATKRKCVVGINIGKNKEVSNEDAVKDYLEVLEIAYDQADYIAVNVSSPNTPNLRELQEADSLDALLSAIKGRISDHRKGTVPKPLLLKIAPDLSNKALEEAVAICLARNIDGIIATNTTVSRSGLSTPSERIESIGDGGLSGAPLQERSNEVIRKVFSLTEGKLPIIGVGGIFTAEDAFEKIRSGASLVQGYTGFVYKGPAYAKNINVGLARILDEKGFGALSEAVGTAVSR
ncbi:MAG: quinone-dependent dihydroorotate dehydrogenase [Pyrinomonadaceae bacterium]|nr:quinone-dependent dihydroorotate dehydrogenase [Pyrinomonadaceae bacterium]